MCIRLLLGAVQENMFETNEIDMEMPPVVNVTTLVPPLPENVPIEHYPDYQVPNDEFMAKLRDVFNTPIMNLLFIFIYYVSVINCSMKKQRIIFWILHVHWDVEYYKRWLHQIEVTG